VFKCYHCGYVFTCIQQRYIRCPNCDSANLSYIPIVFLEKVNQKEINKYGIKIRKLEAHFNNKYVNDEGVDTNMIETDDKHKFREISITGRFYTVNVISSYKKETIEYLAEKAFTVLDKIKERDY